MEQKGANINCGDESPGLEREYSFIQISETSIHLRWVQKIIFYLEKLEAI